MPAGVEVEVSDGFATIEFTELELRGPALARLHVIGGPESISVDTRSGSRVRFTVPEGNAREAGLIDTPAPEPAKKAPAPKKATKVAEKVTGAPKKPTPDPVSDDGGDTP